MIGTFTKENKFTLSIDDNSATDAAQLEDFKKSKATMIIVEPYILIPTTQIVKAFPCVRKAFLSNQYKGLSGDLNYALVLGNVIHQVFQDIL